MHNANRGRKKPPLTQTCVWQGDTLTTAVESKKCPGVKRLQQIKDETIESGNCDKKIRPMGGSSPNRPPARLGFGTNCAILPTWMGKVSGGVVRKQTPSCQVTKRGGKSPPRKNTSVRQMKNHRHHPGADISQDIKQEEKVGPRKG